VDCSSPSFVTNQQTLAVSNVLRPKQQGQADYPDSWLVVQITRKAAYLLEFDMGTGQHTRIGDPWIPEGLLAGRDIVAASINDTQIVLALNGAFLVMLNLSEHNGLHLKHQW
jgi:DNA damage-binding protein 1